MPESEDRSIDPTLVQAAVFDMGGVLLEGGPSDVAAFGSRVGLDKASWDVLRFEVFGNGGAWSALERGEISLDSFVEHLKNEIIKVGGSVDTELAAQFMGDRTPMAQRQRIREDLIEWVGRVKEVVPTALLTNNVVEWRTGWNQMLDVDALFDVIVDSSEVGTRKPEPEIYEITRERLDVAHENIFFVDDIGQNLKAAKRLGWQTLLFRRGEDLVDVLKAICNNN